MRRSPSYSFLRLQRFLRHELSQEVHQPNLPFGSLTI
jgi:hypothetical protein